MPPTVRPPPPLARRLRLLLLGVVVGLAPARAAGSTAPDLAAAWDLLDRMLYQEAAVAFDRLQAAPDPGPAVRLGHALTLLFRQPRTRGNLDAAEATLTALADRADVRWAVLARYYLARIDHVHAFEPDLARAEVRYLALWRDHPDHEFGQRAFVHAALLALHDPDPPGGKRAQLLALDAAAAGLTEPGLRRIYHFHAGEAWQRWLGDDTRAFAHYRILAEAGLARLDDHANLLVRLGELATRLGHPADARRWHEEFLREFPRDPRAHLVRLRLARPAPAAPATP